MGLVESSYSVDNEQYIRELERKCCLPQASPHDLARLRHEVSVVTLNNGSHVEQLSRTATENQIFCPDELRILQQLGIPLPRPHQPGDKATKLLPSNYLFEADIIDVIRCGYRAGLYFMKADVVNAGHIDALKQARASEKCDVLFLVLTSDLVTAGMIPKGAGKDQQTKPVMTFTDRMFMADQLDVDAVYAMPTYTSLARVVWEMVALAKVNEELGIGFDSLGDERIRPLSVEAVKKYYTTDNCWYTSRLHGKERFHPHEDWKFYVNAHLGISPDTVWVNLYKSMNLQPFRDGDAPRFAKYQNLPPDLMYPYFRFWFDLGEMLSDDQINRIILFDSDHDLATTNIHLEQAAICSSFNNAKVAHCLVHSNCPQTSSSLLIGSHPLSSDAEKDALELLKMLKEWDQLIDPRKRLFQNWEKPLQQIRSGEI